MRRRIAIDEFQSMIRARKAALGFDESREAIMRNSGERRTPEKREMLDRIARRARAAGKKPLPANS